MTVFEASINLKMSPSLIDRGDLLRGPKLHVKSIEVLLIAGGKSRRKRMSLRRRPLFDRLSCLPSAFSVYCSCFDWTRQPSPTPRKMSVGVIYWRLVYKEGSVATSGQMSNTLGEVS